MMETTMAVEKRKLRSSNKKIIGVDFGTNVWAACKLTSNFFCAQLQQRVKNRPLQIFALIIKCIIHSTVDDKLSLTSK